MGKILYAHGINYKPRPSIGKVSSPPPLPETLNYDLWAGPAPDRKIMRKYLHYDWHWDWTTGDGDLGNMGIHYMDACRLTLGRDTLPKSVISIGGRFAYEDDGQTPNTMITMLDYEPAPLIFEVRGLPKDRKYLTTAWNRNAGKTMDTYQGVRIGVIVHCEGGYLANSSAFDKSGRLIKKFEPTNKELRANFIDAVRSRRVSDLNSDILEGHLSASLVHMANISHRTGKKASPDELGRTVKSDRDWARSYERFASHLAANAVNLDKTPPTLGARLEFDPASETFVGQKAKTANALAAGTYRDPYVVPRKV